LSTGYLCEKALSVDFFSRVCTAGNILTQFLKVDFCSFLCYSSREPSNIPQTEMFTPIFLSLGRRFRSSYANLYLEVDLYIHN
jgi:hypothetical protein